MKPGDLIDRPGEWLKGSGPRANIALSSRIRLARNLTVTPFPNRASEEQLWTVLRQVEEAIGQILYFNDSSIFRLQDIDELELQLLVERHLMSRQLAENPAAREVIISREEILSVMVNEEDHLRIQVLQSGLNLDGGWSAINAIDTALSRQLPYAFSPESGYLTACPTNTGTALRGSVMLHLPALEMTGQIERMQMTIAKLNFTSRGFYGEGSEVLGSCYQVSNQVSLGHSEETIIRNSTGLIEQIIDQEEHARRGLLEKNRSMIEDKVFRARGILDSARIISSHEAISLVSLVRLGVDLGIITDLDYQSLNEISLFTQPAHLQKMAGQKLNPGDRDILRAQLIREKFKRPRTEG